MFIDNFISKSRQKEITGLLHFSQGFFLAAVSLEMLKQDIDAGQQGDISQKYLSPEEKERFDGFRFEKRRMEWLGGRIAAKVATRDFCKTALHAKETAYNNWSVLSDKNGKPYIKFLSAQAPQVSITHSAGTAVAMVCNEACGVDIERVTERIISLKERFCWPKEEKVLAGLTGQNQQPEFGVTILWCAKEALRKLFGAPPLPGFMELMLINGKLTGRKGLLLEFETGERLQEGRGKDFLVYASQTGEYAWAITVETGADNRE
ncbi:MAG: 4'-phosphopantetheinyl transferase superfamily protein [Proteobacteria bacterium]|nr:4'-phosphopantetheinyl transferase superfamily protein [Pseudomonadota bacterium]MBU1708530.1 4'-phosphopantetheinyl transferase superfamily protein [Pseudomonadota bacterium]